MKRIIPLALVIGAVCLAGCKNQQAAQLAVTGAAAGATAVIVRNNPQSVPDFQAGVLVLNNLAGSTNQLSTNNVTAIMDQVGATNADVQAVVDASLLTLQPFVNGATNSVEQTQLLDSGLQWAAAGIELGIPLGEALNAAKSVKTQSK